MPNFKSYGNYSQTVETVSHRDYYNDKQYDIGTLIEMSGKELPSLFVNVSKMPLLSEKDTV